MRVSENTSQSAVHEALKRTRTRMEELQIKNSTQKKLITPSDDPAANSKILDIRTTKAVHEQFENNANMAKNRLMFADAALQEITEIFTRAKEIAIAQSSDASASSDTRLGVAQEVSALYNQLLSAANRRVGQHYIFGGYKTQTSPYNRLGEYFGDNGQIPIEVGKNIFVPMNLPGPLVFEAPRFKPGEQGRSPAAIDMVPDPSEKFKMTPAEERTPIEKLQGEPEEKFSLFAELDALRVSLLTNDTISIRERLERFDRIIENTITLRAKLSSRVSGIDSTVTNLQKTDLTNAELATKLEDADYADLWSALAKEETVLRSSLQAAQKLIQPTLLEFLR